RAGGVPHGRVRQLALAEQTTRQQKSRRADDTPERRLAEQTTRWRSALAQRTTRRGHHAEQLLTRDGHLAERTTRRSDLAGKAQQPSHRTADTPETCVAEATTRATSASANGRHADELTREGPVSCAKLRRRSIHRGRPERPQPHMLDGRTGGCGRVVCSARS